MQIDSNRDRLLTLLVHALSLILCVFSAYFFLERTLPFDGAFYSFQISETGTFSIANSRYGIFYTQLLPLLFLKLGASLKTFLFVYSLSFALWNYIFCLIIVYVYRKPGIALALVLVQVLAYRLSFFYTVSEIHSSVGPLFLLAAHLASWPEKFNYRAGLVLLVLMVWLSFIHVLSLIPAVFIAGYFVVNRLSLLKDKGFLISFGLGFVAFLLVITSFSDGSYQATKMIGPSDLLDFVMAPSSSQGYQYFKKEFVSLELTFIAGVLCFVALAVAFRKFKMLAFTLVSLLGTWALIMAYNKEPASPFSMQNYWPLFGVFIALPLAYELLPRIRQSWILLLLLVPLFGFSLLGIARKGVYVTDQIDYLKRVTTQNDGQKSYRYIVHPDNVNWDNMQVSWDLSFQSLLISSMNDASCSRTFFSTGDTAIMREWTTCDKNRFYNTTWNPNWFQPPFHKQDFYVLKPCTYKFLNHLQDSTFRDSLLSPANVTIQTDKGSVSLLRNNDRILPITVTNNSKMVIPSRASSAKQLYLNYDVYDLNNRLVIKCGRGSLLESDILPLSSIVTGVTLNLSKLERGSYNLVIDLFRNDCKHFGINHKVRITIY